MDQNSRFLGWVGKDLKLEYTTGGTPVTNFDLSTTESYRDPATGGYKPCTDWHSMVAYGEIAKYLCEYAKKGTMLLISISKHKKRRWEDKEGIKREASEFVIERVKIVPNGKQKEENNN